MTLDNGRAASWRILAGDCRTQLATLEPGSVQTCVTSPPYFGLRDYGTTGQIGLEPTPDQYVAGLVDVFREVRRVLRDDGTVWLNLGDSYSPNWSSQRGGGGFVENERTRWTRLLGTKPKDLLGIPWECAKALRAPYYAGQIKAERDRVWLAATLDAEGSICGFTHERADDGSTRTGVHITITNTSQRLLNEAHRIWPASRSEHENHGATHLGSRPSWRWICHGAENKANLMRELFPYLIGKKDQACLAYTFAILSMDAKRLGHSPQRDEIRGKRAWLMDAMSRLNRGEDFDFPAWIQEPPSLYEPGWYLRSDIIWNKPNPMPESVTDRPTKAHEYVFLLSKGPRYFYDADAIRETSDWGRENNPDWQYQRAATNERKHPSNRNGKSGGFADWQPEAGRNRRSVWTVATQPYPGAHFATFPPKLIEPCILAGSRPGDTVLDPFAGSGTTGLVALRHNRSFVGCELSPEYVQLARWRITDDAPLLNSIAEACA